MIAAIVILASTVAAIVGLVIFLLHLWSKANDRAWARSDMAHDTNLKLVKLEEQYSAAMTVVDLLKSENQQAEAALQEAQDSYNELAMQSIEGISTDSPQAVGLLRHALLRIERMQNLPKVPGAAAAEGGDSDGAVHGSGSDSSAEDE